MFQKRYAGQSEWIEVDEDAAREKLADYFRDVDNVIHDLRSGIELRTTWTFWRWIPK